MSRVKKTRLFFVGNVGSQGGYPYSKGFPGFFFDFGFLADPVGFQLLGLPGNDGKFI